MNRANRPRQSRIPGSSYASRALSRAGDGSTLTLDFTTGVLDPRLTFTRSTTGTYINSSGYVTSAAIDVPRFDYDPTSLTPRGLLIEAIATNHLPGSQTLSGSGWSTGGTVVRTINYATGPDNVALSATRLVMSFSGGNGRIYYSSAYTTLPHTSSVWLKSNTGSNQTLNLWNTNGVGVTCTVTPQWQRFQSVSTAGTSLPGYFYLENPSAVTGVDILAWGAQLEAGSGASSYIPTVASTGNRQADFAVLSDLSAIGFNTAGGSMVMRGYQTKLSSGSYPALASFLDSGDVDVFGIRNDFAGATLYGRFAGTSTSAEATRIITNNAAYAFGMSANPAITTGAITVSMNGSSTTANKSGSATAITTPTKFAITRTGYGLYINCGTINSIKYWPSIKTAAELNSLTT